MQVIKLNATNSTNTYLRQLNLSGLAKDFTVVVTENQTNGRGQRYSQWVSEPGKNLMFSVFKTFLEVPYNNHFCVSIAASLAVFDALKSLHIKQLSVKWPNDILSADKKLCGILIENTVNNNGYLKSSIIGIGLNVNQTQFNNLPKATSLKLITGTTLDMDELLQNILRHLTHYLKLLTQQDFETLKIGYESVLFRKNKPSTFSNLEGETFPGIIKGINADGKLKIMVENHAIKLFNLKEVTLLY